MNEYSKAMLLPMVGMVVTISPSLSLYRMVVLPAASNPTIRILISFFPMRLFSRLPKIFPMIQQWAFSDQQSEIYVWVCSDVKHWKVIIYNNLKRKQEMLYRPKTISKTTLNWIAMNTTHKNLMKTLSCDSAIPSGCIPICSIFSSSALFIHVSPKDWIPHRS